MARLNQLSRDTRANVMVPAAVLVVALAALAGGAVDMLVVGKQRQDLQTLADNAALHAAKEFALADKDKARIEAVATSYVEATRKDAAIRAKPSADLDALAIDVAVSGPVRAHFPGPLAKVSTMTVSARAQITGDAANVCLIGLSDGVKRTISMNNKSQMTANTCAIYSNSTDKQSMYVHPNADITAETIILAGGFHGKSSESLGHPVTDALPIPDPLATRPLPTYAGCDHTDFILTANNDLSAGVYCGGLTVDGAEANLFSGVYVIKDGPLTVRNGGSLKGDYVGFFLTGNDAKLNFETDSTISLSAPKDGEMVGLLVYADPANGVSDTSSTTKDGKEKSGKKLKGGHVISSDNAERLVGTLYLPDDKLVVDGDQPVADKSEYTVIIAKAFELNNGPNLVVNTDYAASDIPVPEGVGPVANAEARLVN